MWWQAYGGVTEKVNREAKIEGRGKRGGIKQRRKGQW